MYRIHFPHPKPVAYARCKYMHQKYNFMEVFFFLLKFVIFNMLQFTEREFVLNMRTD